MEFGVGGHDCGGWLSLVPAPVVSSVVVVVGEVVGEVLAEAGDGGFGVSHEGGLVELFLEGALDRKSVV